MNTPPALTEVHLNTSAFTVEQYLIRKDLLDDSVDRDHYDLDAPYQRPSVWTVEQRRALIKSLIMGLPVGAVTVSELPFDGGYCTKPDGFYRVIDGQQRIRAIRAFVANEFTVPGSWFTPRQLEDGNDRNSEVTWSKLSRLGRWRISMAQLPSMSYDAIREFEYDAEGALVRTKVKKPNGKIEDGGGKYRKRTPDEVLAAEAELFLLLNGGGTAQTDEHMISVANYVTKMRGE